jgi:hypothetical protein
MVTREEFELRFVGRTHRTFVCSGAVWLAGVILGTYVPSLKPIAILLVFLGGWVAAFAALFLLVKPRCPRCGRPEKVSWRRSEPHFLRWFAWRARCRYCGAVAPAR